MTARTAPSGWDPVAGVWKLSCAVAILLGHHMVTYNAWRPGELPAESFYRVLQVFSPLHFFFFSGWLAASGLADLRRGLFPMALARFLRIHVLVVFALCWGLAWRLAVVSSTSGPLGTLWPLPSWDRPIEFLEILRHLSPFGFVDSVRFNYASWYLYQELRLVFLFPLFRWILLQPTLRSWTLILGVWGVGTIGEYLFWSRFPEFRTSPFLTLGYAAIFLVGARLARDMNRFHTMPASLRTSMVVTGVAISWMESWGFRPSLDNPGILMVQTVVGQALVVVGLASIPRIRAWPRWTELTSRWSVGIYLIHPPIHLVFTWLAVQAGNPILLFAGIPLSLGLGAAFHHLVEAPSHDPLRRFANRIGDLFGRTPRKVR